MADVKDRYISPLSTRYASDEMQSVFLNILSFALGGACGLLWQRPNAR